MLRTYTISRVLVLCDGTEGRKTLSDAATAVWAGSSCHLAVREPEKAKIGGRWAACSCRPSWGALTEPAEASKG